jgi:single-strand DNA-binding protein
MFSIAFNRPVKAGDGTWGEVASFVNVLASGRLAEQCAERLKKGSALYLEGRLQTRKYESRGGQSRTVIEIKADQVQFLDRREDEDEGKGHGGSGAGEDSPASPRPVEGDLPF